MIAYQMLYTIAVGVPVLMATAVVGALLRRHGRAERGVWLGGLVLAFALPAIRWMGSFGPDAPTAPVGRAVAALPTIAIPSEIIASEGAWLPSFESVLLAGWVVASVVLALRWAFSWLGLQRLSGEWEPETLDGDEVWVTDRLGPAVAGLLWPRVLIPSWLLEYPGHARSLVVLHEREHIRARDHWLVAGARAIPVLLPWNPVAWLFSRRLLRAVEIDCDRRVLRTHPDVGAYGRTLLDVSRRGDGRLAAQAAFAESEAPLRRRILALTTPAKPFSPLRSAAVAVVGAVLVAGACQVPVPTDESGSVAPREEAPEPVPAATDPAAAAQTGTDTGGDLAAQPQFTPFTRAPTLINADEVRTALRRLQPVEEREPGIGRTVQVYFFIDEAGSVIDARVDESSGVEAYDQAALEAARVFRFSPALNRDERVPVWVSLPITFVGSEPAEANETATAEEQGSAEPGRAEPDSGPSETRAERLARLEETAARLAASGPAVEADLQEGPRFTPFTVAPRMRNAPEVQRALANAYPTDLRDEGIGGVTAVYTFIDAEGVVRNAVVDVSSGNERLDEAAVSVASAARFSPAELRGEPTPVWVSFPINFQVR